MDPPISLASPTEKDRVHTHVLVEYLQAQGVQETKVQLTHRIRVLDTLNKILQVWFKKQKATMKLYPFGSYALGVHGPEGDIDLLMCSSVPRQFVFQNLGYILPNHPSIEKYSLVEHSFVPVIKFTLMGIEIDLIYAKVEPETEAIMAKDLNDKRLLSLGEVDLRSLNGYRVTMSLLKLVPNVATYRTTLVTIKLWAKRRFIYSNIMGFLGGISWALLTAKICQLYPNASASRCVDKFFQFFILWNGQSPIAISNAKLDRPCRDLIKILTPIYPSMNSTYNVSQVTWKIIQKELKRGTDIFRKPFSAFPIQRLLSKKNFFHYKRYIGIGMQPEDKGLVESKLRHFFAAVGKEENLTIIPYPHCIKNHFFIALKTVKGTKTLDLRTPVRQLQSLFPEKTIKFKIYSPKDLEIFNI